MGLLVMILCDTDRYTLIRALTTQKQTKIFSPVELYPDAVI